MSSGISINIKLDRFYQQFLRGYYNCSEPVFMFPRASKKDYLPFALIPLLWYPPEHYKLEDFGDDNFRIFIPEMHDKNVYSMNYISENSLRIFSEVVEKFYFARLYQEFDELYIGGLGPHQTVDVFMEKYKISEDYRDRLLKNYTRFYNWHHQKKYRKHYVKKSISLSQIEQ